MRAGGAPRFRTTSAATRSPAQLHDAFGERERGVARGQSDAACSVGGRMMFKRVMGKASFAKIADRSGQIQLFLQQEALGEAYEAFKGWDVGDIIGAAGVLFRTKTGELSVRVEQLRLLVKSLRPLPDKWHGLADTETRYRQRYVDLIVNDASREVFRTRTRDRALSARLPRCARFPRSRDADDAADSRRRGRAAVHDASQRARSGHVSAHRAGAVSEAAGRRRLRARVRDQPQLPQRGPVDPAQSRIHDARAVPGVRRLSRPHGLDREGDPRAGRRRARLAARSSTRAARYDLGAPFRARHASSRPMHRAQSRASIALVTARS